MNIDNLLYYYQHLPSFINPIFFQIGNFSVRWYGVMYLLAFAIIYWILSMRIKNGEAAYPIEIIVDFFLMAIAGALIGGRLGYILFYNLPYYLQNPFEAFLPIKFTQAGMIFTGFYGMSFYGGLLGVIAVMFLWTKKRKIDFWRWADFIAFAVPAGYFFGRIGNFLNGELFGRTTTAWWGMYFTDGILRYPSQLLEAFFEGIVMFLILWFVRKREMRKGTLAVMYLGLYGFFRFWLEFLREPDPQLGFVFSTLTLGQFFSIIIVSFAVGIYFYSNLTHE